MTDLISRLPHIIVVILVLSLSSCNPASQNSSKETVNQQATSEEELTDSFLKQIEKSNNFIADLDEILERDTLKAITTYSDVDPMQKRIRI